MGPVLDEQGVEQGGVNSGDFYKIYGKSQLQMAQGSALGVELFRDLIISAIGQADDTLLVSNSLHSLQNLLQLSLYYCAKYNVELCPEKTKLQVISTKNMSSEVSYLKEFSPVIMNGVKLKFHDNAELQSSKRHCRVNTSGPALCPACSRHVASIWGWQAER